MMEKRRKRDTGAEPIEIEVKIPVCNAGELREKLQTLGFAAGSVCRETDRYYNSPYYDLREQDKALRIRQVEDLETGRIRTELNCKGPKLDQISLSRKEIEFIIDRPEEMEMVLGELSFHPVECAVIKKRRYFAKGHMTAVIDQVENLGDFLELEILEQGAEKRADGLAEIEGVLEDLGYTLEQSVRSSYLSMLQRKNCREG